MDNEVLDIQIEEINEPEVLDQEASSDVNELDNISTDTLREMLEEILTVEGPEEEASELTEVTDYDPYIYWEGPDGELYCAEELLYKIYEELYTLNLKTDDYSFMNKPLIEYTTQEALITIGLVVALISIGFTFIKHHVFKF